MKELYSYIYEVYVRAIRVEIPTSITAAEFCRKCGYDYKNGVKELDEEHHYRLENLRRLGNETFHTFLYPCPPFYRGEEISAGYLFLVAKPLIVW